MQEDLTWKERKIKWKLGEIAREEKAKGRRVLVRYGRINIEGRWWKWGEREERLVNGKGKNWMEEGGKDREGGRIWKIAFWNVAGIGNKDRDFWQRIREWDIISIMETWLDKKKWEEIRGRLPREYRWRMRKARRRNKKGRECRGMLMRIKKGIEIVEEEEEEGRINCMVRIGSKKWRIVGVYINGDMERRMEGLKEWMEEREMDRRTIIGGDFNARTGEEGGWIVYEGENENEAKGRNSKDKTINKEGRRLIQVI